MQPNDLIEKLFRLIDSQKKALKKLGVVTIHDLLFHFPSRYGDTAEFTTINNISKGETAVIFGRIRGLKTGKAFVKKTPMSEAHIDDDTGSIKAIWLHQPYIAKMIHDGALVRVEGKISERKNELSLVNPKIEVIGKLPIGVGDSLFGDGSAGHTLYPVYPESRGITSNWLYHAMQKIFKSGILETLIDPIPKNILEKYNLPTLKTALIWIHSPHKESDALSARKRFAFEEVFFIQLHKRHDRMLFEQNKAYTVAVEQKDTDEFMVRFPFHATDAQKKAIDQILEDFKKENPMSRLLEGDVGSGKTAVAATAAYSVIRSRPTNQSFGNLQVAYMAPTEILATQHFESFIQYFKHLNINIGLLTGSGCRKFPSKVASNANGWTPISRAQLLKWVSNGEIPILIGTHALIQKSVKFKHLALVVIDEQHRFGTEQRKKLANKEGFAPHLLSMTATPIPRTLALTIYGDLDLTLLDQMPAGRKTVVTEIVTPEKRNDTYEKIKLEMSSGRQLYVICARIDDADPDMEIKLNLRSVTSEAERLKKEVFQDCEIGILHSKMTKDKKEEVMKDFSDGKIDILVATSVVEVGVNVPNATIIIIEGAERFGLAQLHQLRGRVIRSSDQAYCYVFAETKTQKTIDRLRALVTAKNGFELSELDLQLRGGGELAGRKQWGLSDLGMEAIKNLKMVEAARTEATNIISSDPELTKHPLLKQTLSHKKFDIHFE
ncbi:MAG: ATP-dependent DNA helicase RecG [Candidatus Paceibacterota bacterium]|jgi:ATP-dependent DNA helicase RecG